MATLQKRKEIDQRELYDILQASKADLEQGHTKALSTYQKQQALNAI